MLVLKVFEWMNLPSANKTNRFFIPTKLVPHLYLHPDSKIKEVGAPILHLSRSQGSYPPFIQLGKWHDLKTSHPPLFLSVAPVQLLLPGNGAQTISLKPFMCTDCPMLQLNVLMDLCMGDAIFFLLWSLPRFPLVEPSSCLDSFSLSLHLTLSLAAPPSSCPPFCLHTLPLQDFQTPFLNTLLFHSCFLCFSTEPCMLLGKQLCLFRKHSIPTTWDQGGRSVYSCWRNG